MNFSTTESTTLEINGDIITGVYPNNMNASGYNGTITVGTEHEDYIQREPTKDEMILDHAHRVTTRIYDSKSTIRKSYSNHPCVLALLDNMSISIDEIVARLKDAYNSSNAPTLSIETKVLIVGVFQDLLDPYFQSQRTTDEFHAATEVVRAIVGYGFDVGRRDLLNQKVVDKYISVYKETSYDAVKMEKLVTVDSIS